MIAVENLTKDYGGVLALDDVTFQVEQGEIVGFLGPNGAGKSTAMRILTGFTPATSGVARVDGFDVAADPIAVKRRVGYLPERVPLYDEMAVQHFLRYAAEVKGVARGQRTQAVGGVMERCGLEGMGRRLIGNLSRGYRQRVGLAQALIGAPGALILDEPTVGLDPRQIVEIRNLIKDLGKEHTILLSTHILPEVAMLCERVIIINRGRIVAQDRMESFMAGQQPLLLVQVAEAAPALPAVLERVKGVRTVTKLDDGVFELRCEQREISGAVAKAVAEAGFTLMRLEPRSSSLEEAFIAAVARDTGRSAA